MNRLFRARASATVLFALCVHTVPALAQPRPDLAGMYSDPVGLEDFFCVFWCTDGGLARLNALLDDPANDARSIVELYTEAAGYQRDEIVQAKLTPAARATLGLDPADDPGFLNCEPWGFARQIFAPHQISIEQHADEVRLRYGEWAAERTVHLDGLAPPADLAPTRMGYSTGHYEDGALVIETTGISADLAPWGAGFFSLVITDGTHSDALTAIERYTRSADGQRLILDATLEDPWALTEPLMLKKVWHWAPDQEIAAYDSCEEPTEFSRGVGQP